MSVENVEDVLEVREVAPDAEVVLEPVLLRPEATRTMSKLVRVDRQDHRDVPRCMVKVSFS